MFQWVCPSCGKELDISVATCPECAGQQAVPQPAPAASSGAFFWGLLAVTVCAAVLGLAWLARYQSRKPASPRPVEIAARPQPVDASGPAPAAQPAGPESQIEVAGIRAFYDAKNKLHVRAVVVNHGEEGVPGSALKVALRTVDSAAGSPPLGRFTVRLSSELKPGEARQVQAPLESLHTLAAMPPWRQLRAEVELP